MVPVVVEEVMVPVVMVVVGRHLRLAVAQGR
jgi:hypothetical protein